MIFSLDYWGTQDPPRHFPEMYTNLEQPYPFIETTLVDTDEWRFSFLQRQRENHIGGRVDSVLYLIGEVCVDLFMRRGQPGRTFSPALRLHTNRKEVLEPFALAEGLPFDPTKIYVKPLTTIDLAILYPREQLWNPEPPPFYTNGPKTP